VYSCSLGALFIGYSVGTLYVFPHALADPSDLPFDRLYGGKPLPLVHSGFLLNPYFMQLAVLRCGIIAPVRHGMVVLSKLW
jgi:hypothetical protein